MEIDFNNPNKLLVVRQLFERFNYNYGNLFDMAQVDQALASIILVNEDYSNISEERVINRFKCGAKAVQGEGRMYLTSKSTIDVIYHETLHQLTEATRGVSGLIAESYSEEEINEKITKIGENLLIRQIDQLNESFTRFMTELAIPEVTVHDAYQYGADVIRNYYNSLMAKEIDPFFVLEAYAKGNQDDFNRIKNSFGDHFDEVLRNIEMDNNKGYYIFKKMPNTMISNEAMLTIIDEATSSITLK
ncbi:MAG: hypothetical protein J5892_01410 [Bacilli bacterium]|nr:hypothetical protein [Bacilli bacterium]